MKYQILGNGRGPEVSRICWGSVKIHKAEKSATQRVFEYAIDKGVNFFDTADCYGFGQAEKRLGEIIQAASISRDKIVLQTKCGVTDSEDKLVRYYDYSKEHIMKSVEASLKNLRTDYVDILLLHRPDVLFDPEEVAETFEELYQSGKVRYFGVSNQNPGMMELLMRYMKQPLIANQMQFSVVHASMAAREFALNTDHYGEQNRDDGVLNYCRLKDITVQAWSPLQRLFYSGTFLRDPNMPYINIMLEEMGKKYGVAASTMAIAWILRHPAKILPVLGTNNVDHFKEALAALDVEMTREDWYRLLYASGYKDQ